MASEDLALINRHLAELQREVGELRQVIEETTSLAREKTLNEVVELLTPVLGALVEHELAKSSDDDNALAAELRKALPSLGLEGTYEVGEELELFPEDARRELSLDGDIPHGASMVRVIVEASGWRRGFKVILRPKGRLHEVIYDKDV